MCYSSQTQTFSPTKHPLRSNEQQTKEARFVSHLWVLVGELVQVREAGDGILVRVSDELPPPRLHHAADIGQGRLLAEFYLQNMNVLEGTWKQRNH